MIKSERKRTHELEIRCEFAHAEKIRGNFLDLISLISQLLLQLCGWYFNNITADTDTHMEMLELFLHQNTRHEFKEKLKHTADLQII